MLLNRRWIESHIPHQGGMCLLEEVVSWDPVTIQCRSSTHRSPDNPLRAHGRLGAACGIEYAAQAMAVHGALIASTAGGAVVPAGDFDRAASEGIPSGDPAGRSVAGYLASVRNVALHVTRLDDLQDDLLACAQRIAGDSRTVLYDFKLCGGKQLLLTGRASIVFDPGLAGLVTPATPGRGEAPR